jgi:phosphoesterase RecJ-like protein
MRVDAENGATMGKNELAKKFGGGGHRKAAGCTITGTMNIAKRKVRAAVKEMLKEASRR